MRAILRENQGSGNMDAFREILGSPPSGYFVNNLLSYQMFGESTTIFIDNVSGDYPAVVFSIPLDEIPDGSREGDHYHITAS
jgi:hypothetical protein